MYLIVAASLVLLGTFSVPAHGGPPGPEPKMQLVPRVFGTELVAVNGCVREIRQGAHIETFDAHVSPRGNIRVTGSAEDTHAFKECMKRKGRPIE